MARNDYIAQRDAIRKEFFLAGIPAAAYIFAKWYLGKDEKK